MEFLRFIWLPYRSTTKSLSAPEPAPAPAVLWLLLLLLLSKNRTKVSRNKPVLPATLPSHKPFDCCRTF